MGGVRDYQGRIFAGLLIILIGVLFLLGNLDKLDFWDVFFTYWPVILIFIGLWHLVVHESRNWGFGLILIAVGGFFLLNNLDVITGRVWLYFWPLLIIAAGLWIIFRPRFRPSGEKAPEIKEKDLDIFTVLSGSKRRVESKEFKGGKASVLLGSVDLDFSQASLAGNKATLELTAMLGGIEIWVPREWEVVVDSSALLGSVEDKRKSAPAKESRPTLFVKATAILGGIEIK
ncbi:MAG: DUF5668 domain-containing protein [Candidatus Aminicenantes bacterium]|jgi:predicted membrane protein